YYAIADIDKKFIDKFEPESKKSFGISYPLYWMMSNAVYFLITVFALVGIAFAWGTEEAFLRGSALIFAKEISIGNFALSLSGIFSALVVIIITYLVVWFWKKLMDEHILKESGLSAWVRDSIITISVYLVWTGGILISLGVLGLNTTSMAFAFGALGIGLGFGLQNIFNNFISGLILLFERPIQVGDVVEVGGHWGEVKKINVRSTLVQTYTNASLIIPNSEFISAQVTNWSHSDQQIRRDLPVGVAYGSDTELVQQLLLKAAENVKEVRNTPYRPAVQFINFGESSLDFRLRFWSVLDDFVAGESRLRFEIDRLFRENNVQIPFPQRDIHHKTGYFPTDASKELQ
ncbi:MAG: mechanosensitive ion channel, partial [Desulfobacteraceae bacterium]